MFCSGCGRAMAATDQFCPGCGLRTSPPGAPTSLASTAGTAVAPAQQAMPHPMQAPQQVIVVAPKSPGVAAVLSFFWAGLGQIYNGEIGKGILFMILYLFQHS